MLGGHSEREPPDTIPNSVVKTLSADDSVGFPHVKIGHRQALILQYSLEGQCGLGRGCSSLRVQGGARGSKQAKRGSVKSGSESACLAFPIDNSQLNDGRCACRGNVSSDKADTGAGFGQLGVLRGEQH